MDRLITEIKGIGPKKAEYFSKLGIITAEDALYSFPRAYEDRGNIKNISQAVDGETALIEAEICAIKKGRYMRGKRRTTRIMVKDETGIMEVLFFNAGYLEKTLHVKDTYSFFGKVDVNKTGVFMIHPQAERITDNSDKNNDDGRILPIYGLTRGLNQNERRKLAAAVLKLSDDRREYLDSGTIERNKLCGIEYALQNIHFPQDDYHMRAAKYRLIFEELLIFNLALGIMKNRLLRWQSPFKIEKINYEKDLINKLPYKLTGAQLRVIKEISEDMEAGKRMNRLVQGDVGSGKTIIAGAAIYKTIKNGYQTVLMAPTEILARQHYEYFSQLFDDEAFKIRLLTSDVGAKEKREIYSMAETGKLDLIIGTHAVLGKNLNFDRLALVVTDEQHRFGVAQREALSQKGNSPHILVMTATPIPRTLALILYGDMDVSVVDEKPIGRKEIITKTFDDAGRKSAYSFALKEIQRGRQVYIVTPLIEASENLDVKSSEEVFEEAEKYFKPYKTELLHGRMKQAEKDDIMNRFKSGEVQVLVSTVVIEVGINIPNASVMIIENSERFGLAQMHQLRGRVGRGDYQSYCLLVMGNETDIAVKRAKTMEEFSDGFIIAEKDLELRGTGEFFGIRQHGVPDMRIADIVRHRKILKESGKEAAIIMEDDPLLEKPKNISLRQKIDLIYGELNPGL